MTEEVRAAKYEAAEVTRPYAESEASSSLDDKASLISLTPSASSSTPDGPLSRVGTPRATKFEEVADSVVHAIILPSYKEDLDTLKETVSVLASHVLAKSSYDVSSAHDLAYEILTSAVIPGNGTTRFRCSSHSRITDQYVQGIIQ